MNNKRWSYTWTKRPGRNSLKWKEDWKIQKPFSMYLLNLSLITSSSSTWQVQHKWFSLTRVNLFKLEVLESTIRNKSSNSKKSTTIPMTILLRTLLLNKELLRKQGSLLRCRKVVSATLHATIRHITLSISLQGSKSRMAALQQLETSRMTYGSSVCTRGCTNAF